MKKTIRYAACAGWGALAVTAFLMLGGCHSTRKVAQSPEVHNSPGPVVVGIGRSYRQSLRGYLDTPSIRYESFSGRAHLNVHTPESSQNGITVFIRMRRDSAIWISVRPVLGIELVRVLITPDSVKMINFFKKTLTLRSADSLAEMLDIPCDFATLERLVIGNPAVACDSFGHLDVDTSGVCSFYCRQGALKSTYRLQATAVPGPSSVRTTENNRGPVTFITHPHSVRNFRMLENDLEVADSTGRPRSARMTFADYDSVAHRAFSMRRSVLMQTGNETTAELRFTRVAFDQDERFPFPAVPDFTRN